MQVGKNTITFSRAKMVRGHRYRTPNGTIYPSVTTILGSTKPPDAVDGLNAWRNSVGADVADHILRESAVIGTQAHKMNEDYVNSSPIIVDNPRLLARAHHENFKPYLKRIGMVIGTEVALYSDEMRIAGTADCIAEYDGALSIIDYKTKRSPQREEWIEDYFIQTAAYAMMFKEMTGMDVFNGVILVSSEKDTRQEFVTDTRLHMDKFINRLVTYDIKHREEQETEWRAKYMQ